MSYFVGGYGLDSTVSGVLKDTLAQVVPLSIANDASCIESQTSYLAMYGTRKTLPDLVARSGDDDSWLVAVGSPLYHLQSKQRETELVTRFLANPSRVVRDEIDGCFAIFCYDATCKRFLAATDFNNTTPIFYAQTSGAVLFSSHEFVLARAIRPEIDPIGFSQSIQLGETWGTQTRWRGIYKMLPCEICTVDGDRRIRTERYWQPKDEAVWAGSFQEELDRWMALLSESVKKFYIYSGQRPLICDLTAGEDCRLLLAQCHALRIPFTARVTGFPGDTDVVVAKRGAERGGFKLIERRKRWIDREQLLKSATRIILDSDGYHEFLMACSDSATDTESPTDDYGTVDFCGVPGGTAFRGQYYLRGKVIFPSSRFVFDHKFFTRMKYLLDFYPGLLSYSDASFLQGIERMVTEALEEVREFPLGIHVDHVIRVFSTSLLGLKFRNPLYLPYATSSMTRSIYGLSPRYKQGGKLTKACTELLFPQLAFVKTQNGVPTIRKTVWRLPLFLPEYKAQLRKVVGGVTRRLTKWLPSKKWYHNEGLSTETYRTLLSNAPYRGWLSSSKEMVTGSMYNRDALESLLSEARSSSCRHVTTVGRIISLELAFRWVYGEGISRLNG